MSGVTVRLMSDGELTRLEVLRDLDQRRLTTEAAGQLLALERRQVFRLLKGLSDRGFGGPDLEATRSPQQPAQAGGAALRRGSAPARRPAPTTVTFVSGRDGDICIRWTQSCAG